MKNLKDHLESYKVDIETVALKYEKGNSLSDGLVRDLFSDIKSLLGKYLTIGNSAALQHEDNNSQVHFLSCRIRSEIAYELKDYLLLMRNICIGAIKAQAFRDDNAIVDTEYERYITESQDILAKAGYALASYISGVLSKMNDEEFIKKDLMHYKLVESPWYVYKEQYETLSKQMIDLRRQIVGYDDIKESFSQIKIQIEEAIDNLRQQTDAVKVAALDLVSEYSKPQLVVKDIHEKIEHVESVSVVKENLKFKLEKIDSTIKNLKNYVFTVDYKEGNLVQKNINLSQLTSRWLELVLVPYMSDMHEYLKILKTTCDMSVKNMRNKLSLLNDNNHDEFLSDLSINSDKMMEEQNKMFQKINDDMVEVRELLDNEFKISKIYSSKPFLSAGLQSSVNQIMRDQNKLVEVLNKRFGQSQEDLKYFFNRLQKQEKLTEAEKIAFALSNKSGKFATESYDQVFLKQNIFSEFYIIERTEINDRARESINLWKNGYNGSMIVTGSPLSGKTTFANDIVLRNFGSHYVRLKPHSEQSFNGRKFLTDGNLVDALNEISKSRITQPTCIFIDDLELWHNENSHLLQDARGLTDFMTKNGDMVYLLLCINPIALHFLNIYMNFSDQFLSIIDVSKVKFSHFKNIIQLRHTATHKTLVKSDGKEYNPDEFLSLVKQVHKNSDGNVGEGLLRWISGSREISSDQVIYDYKDMKVDNFITPENEMLIEQFLKYKKMKDTELISIFSIEQYQNVRVQLKSLLRTKVLVRDNEGYIHINEFIITDTYKFYKEIFSQKSQMSS
jgi:hypothetical protein